VRNVCAFPFADSDFWAAPLSSKNLRSNFYWIAHHLEVEVILRAKAGRSPGDKGEPNGKAQPFLTSGGQADANNNMILVAAALP